MNKLSSILENIKASHLKKVDSITATLKGYEWFMDNFKDLTYTHIDLRGSNENPTIILATESVLNIPPDIKELFESNENYILFKNNLLSISTAKYKSLNYFYIQCNTDIESEPDVLKVIRCRINNELFPHLDNYLKK